MNKKHFFLIVLFVVCGMPAMAADFEMAKYAVKNMGLGWNLGNTLDANNQSITDPSNDSFWGQQDLNSETCWGQYLTKPELMKMMKEAGFGAIRVPVTWYNHMDKDGNVDAAWMKRVREVVDYVIDQGMYCIINVHHDTGADGSSFTSWIKADEANYNTNKARYEKLWQQIAEEFKDYDQHLLFESYNEMLDKLNSWCYASMNASGKYDASVATSAYNAINSYAQSFVSTVRASGGNNAQRNIIVNTYCASNGYGNWSTHLKEPLTKLNMPTGEYHHIIFEVHAYPDIVIKDNKGNITGNRPITDIKKEVDGMISLLNTELVSKGAPVIFGEWGTSNVDKAETDYDVRRSLMFQFCEYFVQKCKENNIGTFYWMGLTDGASRLFPAFNQADLAKCLLQAYHGSSYDPVLPERSDYTNSCISCTVNYNQQWSEFNLVQGSFTSNDYIRLQLDLEEAPASGLVQVKIYNDKDKTQDVTAATTKVAITADMGKVTRITLQCKQNSGTVKVKNIWLIKKDGTMVPSDPSVFWGCTMSDVGVTTRIGNVYTTEKTNNGIIYDLRGQQQNMPKKGLFIQNGRKYIK